MFPFQIQLACELKKPLFLHERDAHADMVRLLELYREQNQIALATVTSIIDGTGSVGAAIGPFLAGAIHGLDNIFYMLMAADVCALLVS